VASVSFNLSNAGKEGEGEKKGEPTEKKKPTDGDSIFFSPGAAKGKEEGGGRRGRKEAGNWVTSSVYITKWERKRGGSRKKEMPTYVLPQATTREKKRGEERRGKEKGGRGEAGDGGLRVPPDRKEEKKKNVGGGRTQKRLCSLTSSLHRPAEGKKERGGKRKGIGGVPYPAKFFTCLSCWREGGEKRSLREDKQRR